jgi:hypothetical protein
VRLTGGSRTKDALVVLDELQDQANPRWELSLMLKAASLIQIRKEL